MKLFQDYLNIRDPILFDFLSQKKEVESGLEGANTGLAQARNELNTAASDFQQPE